MGAAPFSRSISESSILPTRPFPSKNGCIASNWQCATAHRTSTDATASVRTNPPQVVWQAGRLRHATDSAQFDGTSAPPLIGV